MLKKSLPGGICIIALVLFAACSSDSSSPGSRSRQFVSIGTAPPGGAFFVVGGALGEVLNEFRGENSLQVTAEATKGTQENIRRLDSGDIDFALANAAITYFAVRGEGAWERPYPMRMVMTLAPNVGMFLTPGNSGVKQIGDLKGKRVVLGPAPTAHAVARRYAGINRVDRAGFRPGIPGCHFSGRRDRRIPVRPFEPPPAGPDARGGGAGALPCGGHAAVAARDCGPPAVDSFGAVELVGRPQS